MPISTSKNTYKWAQTSKHPMHNQWTILNRNHTTNYHRVCCAVVLGIFQRTHHLVQVLQLFHNQRTTIVSPPQFKKFLENFKNKESSVPGVLKNIKRTNGFHEKNRQRTDGSLSSFSYFWEPWVCFKTNSFGNFEIRWVGDYIPKLITGE